MAVAQRMRKAGIKDADFDLMGQAIVKAKHFMFAFAFIVAGCCKPLVSCQRGRISQLSEGSVVDSGHADQHTRPW